MSDIALPGSIEPASAGGPKLDHSANPLTAILGVSDLMRDRATDEVTRRQADMVLKQARRAAGIVQHLLAFSRPSALASQKIHPEEIIRKVVEQQAPLLRQKNVSIELKAAAGLGEIEADPRLLQQVFVTLITNAEQAIAGARDSGTIRVSVSQTDSKVVFEFADDGPGIPPAEREKLFLPYYSTKRRGSGLGLAIVRRIIAEHGGSIDVGDNTPRGTRFSIELPS